MSSVGRPRGCAAGGGAAAPAPRWSCPGPCRRPGCRPARTPPSRPASRNPDADKPAASPPDPPARSAQRQERRSAARPARPGPSTGERDPLPSTSSDPVRVAASASMALIRRLRRSRSLTISAGSAVTQRPRSRTSGRLASATAVTSSSVRTSPARVSCQRNSNSASRMNPALVTAAGVGVPLSPPASARPRVSRPATAPRSRRPPGLSRLAEQLRQGIVVEHQGGRGGLAQQRDSGAQTRAPRRSASSRSVSARSPNRASTTAGARHNSSVPRTRLGSAVLLTCRTARAFVRVRRAAPAAAPAARRHPRCRSTGQPAGQFLDALGSRAANSSVPATSGAAAVRTSVSATASQASRSATSPTG